MASKKIAPLLASGRILAARFSSSSASAVDLAGIFPPIPTPFNADESLAFDKLEQNFKVWQKMPFRGIHAQAHWQVLFRLYSSSCQRFFCSTPQQRWEDLIFGSNLFLILFLRQVTWCRAPTVSSSSWKTRSVSRWWRGRGSSLPRTNCFSPAPRVNVSYFVTIGSTAAPRFESRLRYKFELRVLSVLILIDALEGLDFNLYRFKRE